MASDAAAAAAREPIAIIGSGCRFPGQANNTSKLWELLRKPRDLLRAIPKDRFSSEGFYHPNPAYHGSSATKQAYFLDENVRLFDAPFFGVSAEQASAIDPQQRILLEVVYEALEAAGKRIEDLRGSDTAVYVGSSTDNQLVCDVESHRPAAAHQSVAANRLSHFFDWKGPSMTIDTACSSSLVALHQAVQALRQGETKTSVVAGTSLLLGPEPFVAESKSGLLSPTGRSRMFDADADGYGRGEGVAAVILKPLSAAIRDGDNIECVIRETGVNQDGRSDDAADAQAKLIRQVYAHAGLDPRKEEDRCQYLECHGAGSPTGDPIEAQAIAEAFFSREDMSRRRRMSMKPDPLYVGSVKTVVGHTGATAGLAGLMKASLALQHGVVPPNLHFSRLNPAVAPYYAGLGVPLAPLPWPKVLPGQPRRASVHSVGLSGTNVHVLLEAYEAPEEDFEDQSGAALVAPIVLSAKSQDSLKQLVAGHASFLKQNAGQLNLASFASTLLSHRSIFNVRVAFAAADVNGLISQLEAAAESDEANIGFETSDSKSAGAKILGVFTGPGAEWPAMGRELLRTSEFARARLQELDGRLQPLQQRESAAAADGQPTWSLLTKLLEGDSTNEAVMSQCLCTAVQILLVDLLRAAGVYFHAVVGYSSGDIAAAYAAGFLTAGDAICIAYYFGAHQVSQSNGTLAESLSSVVANFVSDRQGAPACRWYSSVYNDEAEKLLSQRPLDVVEYLDANQAAEARFEDVLEKAWAECGPFDAAVEVGPHPMLREQVMTTIEGVADGLRNTPYTAMLQRDKNSMVSVAEALGYLWSVVGDVSTIDIMGYDRLIRGTNHPLAPPRPLPTLPAYPWDKDTEYGHESRISRAHRTRTDPTHVLLGNQLPDGTNGKEYRWRNFLTPQEVPWISKHRVQGKAVFPAAGYAVLAFEAAARVVAGLGKVSVKLVEIQDMSFHGALLFPTDASVVETLFTLTKVSRRTRDGDDTIEGSFCFYASQGSQDDSLSIKASGFLKIRLGETSSDVLPTRPKTTEPSMVSVDSHHFYEALSRVGYKYAEPFRGLAQLQRRSGFASGMIGSHSNAQWAQWPNHGQPLLIHPVFLDAAFQAVMLAYCYPDDGRLWAIHVPKKIQSIRINPELCARHLGQGRGSLVPFEAAESYCGHDGIAGDVDVYSPSGDSDSRQLGMIQVQGFHLVPFVPAGPDNDTRLFSTTVWSPAAPDLRAVSYDSRATAAEYDLAADLERACLYYMNAWEREIPQDHPARTGGPYRELFSFVAEVRQRVRTGQHKYARRGYMEDDEEVLHHIQARHGGSLDMKMVDVVGQNMAAVIRGDKTMADILLAEDDLLSRYYSESLGMKSYTTYLSRSVKQLTHRYPAMKIIEVGAGNGRASKHILQEIGQTFSSYYVTDVASRPLARAQRMLEDFKSKLVFQTFDIEKDIDSQGFEQGSFDLVIASFVLHAAKDLETTLANLRKLLKPGGYLLLAEITNNDAMRSGFCLGSLPDWWVGEQDSSRVLSPCVTPVVWDSLLWQAGFSGVDSITADEDPLPCPASIIATQALDEKISLLREPTTAALLEHGPLNRHLVLIGGASLRTSRLMQQIRSLLAPLYGTVTMLKSVEEATPLRLSSLLESDSKATVLCVSDLDAPLFANLTEAKLQGLKVIYESARTIVWFTEGRRADNAYMNMSVGFGRSMLWEIPGLHLHFIDLAASEGPSRVSKADAFATPLLQFDLAAKWKVEEPESSIANRLWSIELETEHTADGRVLIPRLVENKQANQRYNSARRAIEAKADPAQVSVVAELLPKSATDFEPTSMQLVEGQTIQALRNKVMEPDSLSVLVHVTYTSTWCVPIGRDSHLYLLFGAVDGTGEHVIALSENIGSSVVLPLDRVVHGLSSLHPYFVSLVIDDLIVTNLLADLSKGDTLVVMEPGKRFAQILLDRAKPAGIAVKFITVVSAIGSSIPSKQWIVLPPRARQRDLAQALPAAIDTFVDLSLGATETVTAEVAKMIVDRLPRSCEVRRPDSVYTQTTHLNRRERNDVLRSSLGDAVSRALSTLRETSRIETPAISITALSKLTPLKNYPSAENVPQIVSWKPASAQETSLLPINVRPADVTTAPLFKSNRSYWLVGLTRDLGLSLTEWMIRHGAKYIILSSRNPDVDPVWLARMQSLGGEIQVLACDVTSLDSVRSCHHQITRKCPSLAGIAHGAMVLRDALFREMDLDKMNAVLEPKVQGSLHLEEVLPTPDDDLDFFVYFSSIAGLMGRLGQSNDSAANAFLMSRARARKARGLAASVINIGVVVGMGYITRQKPTLDEARDGGYMWLPEQSFHAMFAEAILAGRKDSTSDPEISTGVAHVGVWEDRKPIWFDNPLFSHHILNVIPEASSSLDLESQDDLTDEVTVVEEVSETNTPHIEIAPTVERQAQEPETASSQIETVVKDEKPSPVDPVVLPTKEAVAASEVPLKSPTTIKEQVEPGLARSSSTSNLRLKRLSRRYPVNGHSDSVSTTISTSGTVQSLGSPVTASPQSSRPGSAQYNSSAQYNVIRSGPLSHGQSNFWFLDLMTEDNATLNQTYVYQIAGRMRTADLKRAVAQVIARHEILRTCFRIDTNGQPTQMVLEQGRVQLEVKPIKSREDVSNVFNNLKSHPFKLESGESFRVLLLKSPSPQESYLVCSFHQILVDEGSQQVLMQDLERAYLGESLGQQPLQFLDYALRMDEESKHGAWNDDLAYWRRTFASPAAAMPILPLPDAAVARSRLANYDFHSVSASINQEVAQNIKECMQNLKITPLHFYLAIFRTLLARLIDHHRFVVSDNTENEGFAVGIANKNRTMENSDSVGPYANLVPLRFSPAKADHTFIDILQDTQSTTFDAQAHATVPFGAILEALQVSVAEDHSPLFQAFMDYRDDSAGNASFQFADMQLDQIDTHVGKTAYDVYVQVSDLSDGCRIVVKLQSKLYSETDAQVLMGCFQTALEAFSRRPTQEIFEPSIFPFDSVRAAVKLGAGPVMSSQWGADTLIHRIRHIVKSCGADEAIKDQDTVLTYDQMWRRVVSIGTQLGDGKESDGSSEPRMVAVFQDRTVDWICSLLAIWLVGDIYVPLDPTLPTEALRGIIVDCQPAIVVIDRTSAVKVSHLGLERLRQVPDLLSISAIPQSVGTEQLDVPIHANEENPAVVFYTSGTTSMAKGIGLRHSSLTNEIEFGARDYGIGSCERVLQHSGLVLNTSLMQIFSALAFGGCVYMCPTTALDNPSALSRIIAQERISVTVARPSEYLSWINHESPETFSNLESSRWRVAISGGNEQMTPELVQAFRRLGIYRTLGKNYLRLFNVYGPTEVTGSSSRYQVNLAEDDKEVFIPAGLTAPNARVTVVDRKMNALPLGFRGELAVAGLGVAMGYLNRPEETEERFVIDQASTEEGSFVHRTGDVGSLLPDGRLVISGRIANETEVELCNGLRVDLREIERTIVSLSDGCLVEAVVSVRVNADEQVLVCHVVFTNDVPDEDRGTYIAAIKDKLPSLLPRHMVPSLLIPLEELPRSRTTDKIDRRAIANFPLLASVDDDSHDIKIVYEEVPAVRAVLTADEEKLQTIWEQVLPQEVVAVHHITPKSDLFRLGGSSLMLPELQRRIQGAFGVSLGLGALFKYSTLGQMSELVRMAGAGGGDEHIDWDVEIEELFHGLVGEVTTAKADPERLPKSPPQVIVLTGATGQLGRALLDHLVALDHVQTVHCIAVRNPEKLSFASGNSKIQVHTGDLAKPLLGLAPAQAETIFTEADLILHNGALVSHLKSYHSLRAENVLSTVELVRLALPRRIPVHYVSSAQVSMYFAAAKVHGVESTVPEFEPVSVAQYPPEGDGVDGYTASKWASERLLEELSLLCASVSSSWPLQVVIHRPSNILRHDTAEVGGEGDLVGNVLQLSQRMRKAPRSLGKMHGVVNLVDVQTCAEGIVALAAAMDGEIDGTGETVRYVHHIGERNVALDDVAGFVESDGEGSVEVLTVEEWTSLAEEMGLSHSVAEFLKAVEGGNRVFVYPMLKSA